jgi:hypothetical protein
MIRPLAVVGVALSLYGFAIAQQPLRAVDIPISPAATQSAQEFRNLKIDKALVHQRVRKLTKELTWHKKLDAALAASQQSGKPVLWIQALGKLTGYV